MRDFTLAMYRMLLAELHRQRFEFMPFADFLEKPGSHCVILRHDVDRNPRASVTMAGIESNLGICGSYFFRVKAGRMPSQEIRQVASLGHEIGYHYEDLSAAGGDARRALESFQRNLDSLRVLAPVRTACMHGSPLSPHDNRDLWKESNYRHFGIIGEPYFDVDFGQVLYLTDTGRTWGGEAVSLRDKVRGGGPVARECPGESFRRVGDSQVVKHDLRTTMDIIQAMRSGRLPERIMLTLHPQRWNDSWLPWLAELGKQKLKNPFKRFLALRIARRKRNSLQ